MNSGKSRSRCARSRSRHRKPSIGPIIRAKCGRLRPMVELLKSATKPVPLKLRSEKCKTNRRLNWLAPNRRAKKKIKLLQQEWSKKTWRRSPAKPKSRPINAIRLPSNYARPGPNSNS